MGPEMEVAQEQLRLLREAIARAKEAHDLTALADYKTAEINFRGFIDKFGRDISNQRNIIARNSHHRGTRLLAEPNARSPMLFMSNQPVLKLNVYNFPVRVSKKDVHEMLVYNRITDFTVDKVLRSSVPSGALITVRHLATSCELQTRAQSGTLVFLHKKRSGSSRLAVRPHVELYFEGLSDRIKGTVRYVPVRSNLLDALCIGEVLTTLFKYLNPEDCFSLYSAASGYEQTFQRSRIFKFDASLERYKVRNSHEVMFEDAKTFKFKEFDFSRVHAEILCSIVKNIFQCQIAMNDKGTEKIKLNSVNLKSVKVSYSLIELISRHFKVKKLILSKTSDVYDKVFHVDDIRELLIVDSPLTRIRFLTPNSFNSMKQLILIKCHALLFENLMSFVKENQTLETLVLIDCTCIDKQIPTCRLIEAIYSG